jgi:hypothetical protein
MSWKVLRVTSNLTLHLYLEQMNRYAPHPGFFDVNRPVKNDVLKVVIRRGGRAAD